MKQSRKKCRVLRGVLTLGLLAGLLMGLCLPAFAASLEPPSQELETVSASQPASTGELRWSRGLADGTVVEEMDTHGNYRFICPTG